jgi:hypothetical protein
MMLCGPIGLWLVLRERGATQRKGQEPDPDSKKALIVSSIATVLFVLVVLILLVYGLFVRGSLNLQNF